MAGGTKTFTTEIDAATGKVLKSGVAGAAKETIPRDSVTLAEKKGGAIVHHKVVFVSEGTVIHTKTNPVCQWIFMGGQWIRFCS